jgi:hypothetical protein
VAEDPVKQLDAAVLDQEETEGRAHLVLRAQCAEQEQEPGPPEPIG